MGKVTTIYIPDPKAEVWKAFEELAAREKGKRGTSEMLIAVIEEYVKAHGDGNSQYKLDDDVVAYPTPWKDKWTKEMLDQLSQNELLEMRKLLKEKLLLIDAHIDKAQPSPKRQYSRCRYCDKPMLMGEEAHMLGNDDCRAKGRKDRSYSGPPFNEVDPTLVKQ